MTDHPAIETLARKFEPKSWQRANTDADTPAYKGRRTRSVLMARAAYRLVAEDIANGSQAMRLAASERLYSPFNEESGARAWDWLVGHRAAIDARLKEVLGD